MKLCGLLVLGGFFGGLCAVAALKDGRQSLQGGGFPLADLVRVNAMFGGDLSQRSVFAQHLLDDLGLKSGGVMFSGCHGGGPHTAHLILDHFAV